MSDFELTSHVKDMLIERNILEEWLMRTIIHPDENRIGDDDNMHYTRAIQEKDGRILHVVVNPNVQPNRVITVFFDRRLRKN